MKFLRIFSAIIAVGSMHCVSVAQNIVKDDDIFLRIKYLSKDQYIHCQMKLGGRSRAEAESMYNTDVKAADHFSKSGKYYTQSTKSEIREIETKLLASCVRYINGIK